MRTLLKVATSCLLFAACACASDDAVPGQTGADKALQADIKRVITIQEAVNGGTCRMSTITNTERAGLAQERWTVDRCGQRVTYLVTFIPTARQDRTDFRVQREE